MNAVRLHEGRPILWEPTPKQEEFLTAPQFEVLYGGAAGGGKTEGLLIDALGEWQRATEKPLYRALILRRTFPELRAIIDRSRALYAKAKPAATYNESAKEWRFPSGAKIIFGYAERDADRFQYQGGEYQYVGFEELTQWPTDVIYRYLLSRVRTSDPNLKCLVRATCNPGGVGHKWVKNWWEIPNHGGPTKFVTLNVVEDNNGQEVRVETSRRFIPARLSDNPYLGIEYKAQLNMLSDVERAQLLDGRWDVVEIPGQIYKAELERAYAEDRIRAVPHEPILPVHTAWDLGVSDATSILFFQVVKGSGEVRIIDYHEATGEGLPYYARVLQEKGYVYGTHWGPHDLRVRELGSGVSRIDQAKALGIKFEIVPQVGFDDGIAAVRSSFQKLWFDTGKTDRLLECLRNYRKDYNNALGEFKPTPVHNWASHGADALRYACLALSGIKEPRKKQHGTNYEFGGWCG